MMKFILNSEPYGIFNVESTAGIQYDYVFDSNQLRY